MKITEVGRIHSVVFFDAHSNGSIQIARFFPSLYAQLPRVPQRLSHAFSGGCVGSYTGAKWLIPSSRLHSSGIADFLEKIALVRKFGSWWIVRRVPVV